MDARPLRGSTAPLLTGLDRRRTKGEFLVDLAHTTYPGYALGDYYTAGYWRRALLGHSRVRLALESELGTYRVPGESFAKVIEDAAKVAAFRADVKVVVFASQYGGAENVDLVGALETLRRQADDPAPWLWADLPWDSGSDGTWQPSQGCLG